MDLLLVILNELIVWCVNKVLTTHDLCTLFTSLGVISMHVYLWLILISCWDPKNSSFISFLWWASLIGSSQKNRLTFGWSQKRYVVMYSFGLLTLEEIPQNATNAFATTCNYCHLQLALQRLNDNERYSTTTWNFPVIFWKGYMNI
jgi:hypothetical protein